MATSNQVLEMIQYWVAQEDSEQKRTVLAFWIKQASKFAKVSRYTIGGLVTNTTIERKEAFNALALAHGVPAKKAGENISQQSHRLTTGKGFTITIRQALDQLTTQA